MNLAQQFETLLREQAADLGVALNENLDEVRAYAAEQMLLLKDAVDEPGFGEVLRAAGINVMLKAASEVVEAADQLDERLVNFVTGALGIAARALAPSA